MARDQAFIIVALILSAKRFINDLSVSARATGARPLRGTTLTVRWVLVGGQMRVSCPLSIKSFDRLTSR